MNANRRTPAALVRRCILLASIAGTPAVLSVRVDPGHVRPTPEANQRIVRELKAGRYVTYVWNQDDRAIQRVFASHWSGGPDRLVLGSSRTQTVPALAYPRESFHNASVSDGRLDDMLGLYALYDSTGKRPRSVTIGLDPWTLMPLKSRVKWREVFESRGAMLRRLGDSSSYWLTRTSMRVDDFKTVVAPEYFRLSLFSLRIYGSNGQQFTVTDTSLDHYAVFTPHGNIIWPKTRPALTARAARDYVDRRRRGIALYNGDTDVEREEVLESFLIYMRRQGVQIDLLLAPLHPLVYQDFASLRNNPLSVHEARYRAMAQRVGARVIGSYNPTALGVTAADLFDEWHVRPEALVRIIREARRP